MSLSLLDAGLDEEVAAMVAEGRAKAPERVIVDTVPPQGPYGRRYKLAGRDLSYMDNEDIDQIVNKTMEQNYGFKDLVKNIISHDIFTRR